jgi:hypothetical protein
MAAETVVKGDRVNKSIEPIILTVALILLIAAAAGLALTFPSIQDITGVPSTTPTGHTPSKLNADDLQAELAAWNTPANWPDNKHQLFISDSFLFYPGLYPDGNYLQKNDGSARSPGGVLISWYQKYGIDFTDQNVDREDPDNDGFSNIVEFKNEQLKASEADGTKSTNPLDSQSHPTYLSRIRLQKYDSRPFHIQFRGYQQLGGIFEFQIFLKDVPSDSQPGLKKTGDPLGYEGYLIGAFHQNIVSKEDPATHITTQVDESTLELDKPDIDFKISLVFRQEVDSPESTADFIMLMPSEVDKVIKVARGKVFTPPFMNGTEFLVIDASAQGALIRDGKTKKEINIPLLDPKEWDEVPTAGGAKSSASSTAPAQ